MHLGSVVVRRGRSWLFGCSLQALGPGRAWATVVRAKLSAESPTRVDECFRYQGAEVANRRPIEQQIFHAGSRRQALSTMLLKSFGGIDWPITWVENGSMDTPLCGTFVRAIRGVELEPIRLRDRVVGNVYEDAYARYAVFGDLRDEAVERSTAAQAEQVFADMDEALRLADMDFSHVLRTWFYNRDILAWYGDFNRVRTDFFQARRVLDGLVPASTGIGASNPFGSALIASLVAMKP